jgi:uncharacterized phage protein gp47/JayE
MPIKLPSLAEAREIIASVFKALFPDRNVGSARSYHGRRITVLGAAVSLLHRQVAGVATDILPTTAPDDGAIDEWGGIYGIERNDPIGASADAAGRVRGLAASTVTIGTELVHPLSQLRFKIASSVVIPGAPLYLDADIEAIDTGAATRLAAGEVLEFVGSAPAGIENQVTLVKDLAGGADAEQFGAYRQRVLDAMGNPPSGGNPADFEAWALEVDGIAKARVYRKRAGLGTTDVAVLHAGTGDTRIPSSGTRAAVLAYLKGKAPGQIAGDPGSLRVLEPIADEQDVEMLIQPRNDAAFAFDWTGDMTVSAYNAGTREVTVTGGVLPDSLFAGARIVVKGVASAQLGEEMIVESITDVDKFTVQDVPDVALAATDVIYSGGPLVTPIRNALCAHLDGEKVFAARGGVPKGESQLVEDDETTVGLEVIAEGVDTANPDGEYGAWTGGIVSDVLRQIAMAKVGVRKTTLVTPAADYEAEDYQFPNDAQIGLVTRGAVLVREG